MPENDVLLI
jgi:senataxin